MFLHSYRPDVLWAQRNDTVLLTINLSDIKNEKVNLEENVFNFRGNAGPEGKLYSIDLTFHKEVVPQVCECLRELLSPTPGWNPPLD